MHTFVKSTYCSYYIAIQKRVSGIHSGFGYPRILVSGMDFDPNRCSGRVRVLSSDFDFGCPEAPPNSNPIHCHPNAIVVVPFLCFRQAF